MASASPLRRIRYWIKLCNNIHALPAKLSILAARTGLTVYTLVKYAWDSSGRRLCIDGVTLLPRVARLLNVFFRLHNITVLPLHFYGRYKFFFPPLTRRNLQPFTILLTYGKAGHPCMHHLTVSSYIHSYICNRFDIHSSLHLSSF